jgi:hypothetical protein
LIITRPHTGYGLLLIVPLGNLVEDRKLATAHDR